MSVQTSLGYFVPGVDRVLLSGNIVNPPNWIDPTMTQYILTNDPGNPTIYKNTFTNKVAVGGYENHKFIIDVGSVATLASLGWETSDNRFFQVTASDQILPIVFFNNISNTTSLVTTSVTFSVNMGVQATLGAFEPSTDFVWVAADAFNNNWAEGAQVLTNSVSDPDVWTGTFLITNTVGATVNYKFIKNTFADGVAWEVNGVGPGGAQNRQFAFTNVATDLPVVYFNNITNASSLVTTQVTFQVNVAAQTASGAFDPNVGTVSVAGDPLNGWDPSVSQLTPTLTNNLLWVGTFDITNTVGSAVNYKFTLNNGGSWEVDGVGPGGANDRQFTFANETTVLPIVYFDNLNNLGNLTISPVTAGEVTVSWSAGPLVRLQTNAAPMGSWTDVPDTAGTSSVTLPVGTSNTYFRLIGP